MLSNPGPAPASSEHLRALAIIEAIIAGEGRNNSEVGQEVMNIAYGAHINGLIGALGGIAAGLLKSTGWSPDRIHEWLVDQELKFMSTKREGQ